MSYPKKVIVVVTCHGLITIDKSDNEPNLFKIPDNMKVIKMSAVTHGVCNFTNDQDVNKFIKMIIHKKNKTELKKGLKNPEKYTETLANLYKEIEADTVKDAFNATPDSNSDIRNTYNHHRDKSYEIITYNHKHPYMINKEYIRNNKSEQNSSQWDYGIYCLNVEGKPDLITKLKGRTYADKDTTIYLKEILDFLHDKGVKEIILLDLSCSNFEYQVDENNKETEVSERNTRSIRSNLIKGKLNGGGGGASRVHRKKGTIRKHRLIGGRKTKMNKLNKTCKSCRTRKRKHFKNIRGGSEEEEQKKRKDNMNKILKIISKNYQNKDDRNAAYKRVMGFSPEIFKEIINEIDNGNPDFLITYLEIDGFVPGIMNTNVNEQEKKRKYIMKIMQSINKISKNNAQNNELFNWFNMFSLEHLRQIIDNIQVDPLFIKKMLIAREQMRSNVNPLLNTNKRIIKKNFDNGSVYIGEFMNNKRHGIGKMFDSKRKGFYDGQWQYDKRHGWGHQIEPYNNLEYEGEFQYGKRHGQGKMEWDGNVYVGEFKDDKRHGKGTLTTKNGVVKSGQWINDKFIDNNKDNNKDNTDNSV